MKKFGIALFCSLLFIAVFAVHLPVQAYPPGEKQENIVNSSVKQFFYHHDQEIERKNDHGVAPVRSNKTLQKTAAFQQKVPHKILTGALRNSFNSRTFEPFDNNYLSQLFPSHNFW
jgi:hypothetical protein